MCIFYIPVGGGYVTTRGCAPFDTETFSANLQKGMAGTYWKSSDAYSFCKNSLCNSALSIKTHAFTLNIVLFSIYYFISYK